jgi:hypothetical protein
MVKTIERCRVAFLLPTLAVVGCTAILGLGDPTVDADAGSTSGSGGATGNPGSGGVNAAAGASGSAAPGGSSGGNVRAGAGGAAGSGASGSAGTAGSQGAAGGVVDAGVDVSRFLGTWRTSTGTTALSGCSNGLTYPPKNGVTVIIVVARGTSSDLLMTDPNGCSLKANVTGSNAVVVSGQVCTNTSAGTTETDTFLTGSTFFVAANGTAAEMALQGNGVITDGTNTLTCKFQNYFPLSK